MKMRLKTKLIISYTALSLALVLALVIISNVLLERQFNSYIKKKFEQKNLAVVQAVLTEFETHRPPRPEQLVNIGYNALDDGVILMIKDKYDKQFFCMSCYDGIRCDDMLNTTESAMEKRYPNFAGDYAEKTYPLTNSDTNYGSVILGYYGPFYYNEEDIRFMEILNCLFVTAAFVFLFIAVILGFFMADRISKPIKSVTVKANEIKKGNYSDKISFTSKTIEIDDLIENVNSLAAALEAQQILKKRMAMDYAHEFRTPLAAIQSNLEGVIDGIFEPTSERIENIREEILRLSRMVSDIDKIAELSETLNNNLILQKENFDFCELLKKILITFEADILDKNIEPNINAESCRLYADKDKISGAVMNLISNAVKFTEKNGKIDIILKNNKDNILFSVADNGIGIDKADVPYIFEHLYRADVSRTRNTGGSGIGLSAAKAVADAHGGTIEVKSEIGVGSVFTLILPKK